MSYLNRLTDRIENRLRRARPGSVLILVVALLVILALLGTAYISTSRTDRYSSAQHAANTEIDLLVDGMVSQAVGAITTDLYGVNGTMYRPGQPLANGYKNYDIPVEDLWMADRIPFVTVSPAASASGANPPVFRRVSLPFTFNNATGNGYQFERPDNGLPLPLSANPLNIQLPWSGYEFKPTAAAFAGQASFPFLEVTLNGTAVANSPVPAADADGDGIADAGLWKIPVGVIDGVTYYAAFRIIDNNSAVNVNTAMSQNGDFNGATPPVRFAGAANQNYGFFSSNVGLAELLHTYAPAGTGPNTMGTEFKELFNYRFHMPYAKGSTPTPPEGVAGGTGSPLDDAGAGRIDFNYISIGDALQSQLTRRLLYPGMSTTAAGPPLDRFHPFGFADQAALAYHFVLVNPDASPSPLEQTVSEAVGPAPTDRDSIYRSAPNYITKFRQYSPDTSTAANTAADIAAWYNQNFDFLNQTAGAEMPLRAILTASNPVANQMPAYYFTGATPYELPPQGPPNAMTAYNRGAGPVPLDPMPPNPPRASVNTATFAELFRAYVNVMSGDVTGQSPVADAIIRFDRNGNGDPASPISIARRNARLDPYYGQGFLAAAPYTNDATEQHPRRMFRSSIRDTRVTTTGFTPGSVAEFDDYNEMLLRAALAAVNTEDLRDSDDDVTHHRITLSARVNNVVTTSEVIVYGTERQPFITEVYVNNDNVTAGPTGPNPNGYVAVELYNPYPVPIVLGVQPGANPGGWSVGLVDRRPSAPAPTPARVRAAPEQEITALDPTLSPNWRFPAGTVIPPGGYLVLENYDFSGASPGCAVYRPLGAQQGGLLAQDAAQNPATVFVPGLHRVFTNPNDLTERGGEMVLLRTRRSDAVGSTSAVAGDTYNENTFLYDLIPVDQFDFTGMALPPGPVGPFLWAHYVRESLGADQAWRWVYPGRYDAGATVQTPAVAGVVNARHQGVQQVAMVANSEATIIPTAQKPLTLSVGSAASVVATAYTNRFTIQLANTDFGGPNKLAGAPHAFPYGAFARNGDILQVPFIGAYKVMPQTPSAVNAFLELNSVTMDSVFAEDTDTLNDPLVTDTGIQDREQVGRFYPIDRITPAGVNETDDYTTGVATANPPAPPDPNNQNIPGEYWNATQTGNNPTLPTTYVPQWRYHWALDLFDYLTVQAPNNDFFPNVSPDYYTPAPLAVSNAGGTPGNASLLDSGNVNNDRVEDKRAVEGLININTASWRVLATLPMAVDPATGLVVPDRNNRLAQAIVYWRDVDGDPITAGNQPHGPFKSIYELNRVIDITGLPAMTPAVTFRTGGGLIDPTSAVDPGDTLGDVSPANFPTAPAQPEDGVRRDFEENMLTLTRISNLITTRSDTYTCYLLVQGWRDVGTPNPTLVVQRRVAFLVDRSETTPTSNPPAKVTFIPNN